MEFGLFSLVDRDVIMWYDSEHSSSLVAGVGYGLPKAFIRRDGPLAFRRGIGAGISSDHYYSYSTIPAAAVHRTVLRISILHHGY